MLRRRMFRLLRPAARSAREVQSLCRRTLHAAIRAERAAVIRLRSAVTGDITASRWDLHIGQVRTEIWTVPPLTTRIIPGRKNVSGAELNPLSLCGVNHALHQADDSVAAAAGLRRFSGGGCGCAARRLVTESSITDAKPRTETLRNGKMFRNLERAARRGAAVAQSRLKGTAGPGLPGVFGSPERNRRCPQFREPRTSSSSVAPPRPRFTSAGTVLLAFHAAAIARIRREVST
jgi:hypothetical protein